MGNIVTCTAEPWNATTFIYSIHLRQIMGKLKHQDNAVFNFYGLCRIGYGYIDYFLIRIKVLARFLGTQGLDINPSKSD